MQENNLNLLFFSCDHLLQSESTTPQTETLGGGLRFGILPCSPPHFLRTAHWGCRIARQTGASVGGAKSDLKLTSGMISWSQMTGLAFPSHLPILQGPTNVQRECQVQFFKEEIFLQ